LPSGGRADEEQESVGAAAAAVGDEVARGVGGFLESALGEIEIGERIRGVGRGRVDAQRLAELRFGAREGADLQGGEARQIATSGVVRPALEPAVETGEGAACVATREQDAAAEQIAERRFGERVHQRLGLVETFHVDEQIGLEESQVLMSLGRRLDRAVDRLESLVQVAAAAFELAQLHVRLPRAEQLDACREQRARLVHLALRLEAAGERSADLQVFGRFRERLLKRGGIVAALEFVEARDQLQRGLSVGPFRPPLGRLGARVLEALKKLARETSAYRGVRVSTLQRASRSSCAFSASSIRSSLARIVACNSSAAWSSGASSRRRVVSRNASSCRLAPSSA
jgi:hypothetical protein